MTTPAGRELDAELWTLLGHEVVGWTEHAPVYLDVCLCDVVDGDEPKFAGHFVCCLAVVPHLHETYEGMGLLIEEMRKPERGFACEITIRRTGGALARFLHYTTEGRWDNEWWGEGKDAPDAVAPAAYAALKGE